MSSAPDTAAEDSPVQQSSETAENLSEKLEKMKVSSPSFSIWPPTQRTRDAVLNRLIETLSSPSVLSKRYGTMSHDKATVIGRTIEEEAYTTATAFGAENPSIEEGIDILQVYSKEISKRMLDAVKSRAVTNPAPAPADKSSVPETADTLGIEEVPSVDNESSA